MCIIVVVDSSQLLVCVLKVESVVGLGDDVVVVVLEGEQVEGELVQLTLRYIDIIFR